MLAAEALAKIAQRGVMQQVRQTAGRIVYGICLYGETVDIDGGELFLIVEQNFFDRGDQTAGADVFLVGAFRQQSQGFVGEFDLNTIGSEIALLREDDVALGVAQDLAEIVGLKAVQYGDDRQAADELRFEAVFDQVLRPRPGQQLVALDLFDGGVGVGAEAHRSLVAAACDDFVEPGKGAADDEEDVYSAVLESKD